MMIEEEELDLETEPAKPKGGMRKKLLVVLALLLVLAGAGGAAFYLLLDTDEAANPEAAEAPALIYQELEPELLGNIEGAGRVRFVQVGLVLATRDPGVIEVVNEHMPVIRNDLLMLLSSKTYDVLITAEGKEETRGEMLEAIRAVVREHTGEPGIESIYFTAFVMQ
ncbi:flagellar basal body-associated protein FliL [Thioalkalivibrio sp.]|uniref:flagellar basal body-associated FliL family protein n=1 Tax=Thioalkalivibrio sp. TaxID=2093813 RepID=UPI003975FD1E